MQVSPPTWQFVPEDLDAGDLTALYRTVVDGTLDPESLVEGAEAEAPEPLPDAAHPVLRMMRHDLVTYLPSDILVKTDRASMSVGLELRSPLLDHHVVEAALGMPPTWTWDEGRGKRALKAVLAVLITAALLAAVALLVARLGGFAP